MKVLIFGEFGRKNAYLRRMTHASNHIRNSIPKFDLLTLESMHAYSLSSTIILSILMLIAKVIFHLERGQTNGQTDRRN